MKEKHVRFRFGMWFGHCCLSLTYDVFHKPQTVGNRNRAIIIPSTSAIDKYQRIEHETKLGIEIHYGEEGVAQVETLHDYCGGAYEK